VVGALAGVRAQGQAEGPEEGRQIAHLPLGLEG
jgi:hypothetical protein